MNIAIIKFGALGDIVMTTPLIKAIQAHHHGEDVHLLTTPSYAPIFAHWDNLKIISKPRRGLRNSISTLHSLRRLKCSHLYDLQGNDRSAVLCALAGVKVRVGNHNRFPYTHHPATKWTGQTHIFERMRDVLASADIVDIDKTPVLPTTTEEHGRVEDWIAANGLIAKDFVLLHASASPSRTEKCWPYFEQLGVRLSAHGLVPVWLGSATDRELNREYCEKAGGVDASGAFSITGLAELGRHARFAVTNDSGPMHVLAAAAIPVFGLFGPSDWRRNHALGQRENVIACTEICPAFAGQRTADCLDSLKVEMVWQRLSDRGLV